MLRCESRKLLGSRKNHLDIFPQREVDSRSQRDRAVVTQMPRARVGISFKACAARAAVAGYDRTSVQLVMLAGAPRVSAGLIEGAGAGTANLSFQRIFPVACITTNRVMIEPLVIARPVKPFRKNA